MLCNELRQPRDSPYSLSSSGVYLQPLRMHMLAFVFVTLPLHANLTCADACGLDVYLQETEKTACLHTDRAIQSAQRHNRKHAQEVNRTDRTYMSMLPLSVRLISGKGVLFPASHKPHFLSHWMWYYPWAYVAEYKI